MTKRVSASEREGSRQQRTTEGSIQSSPVQSSPVDVPDTYRFPGAPPRSCSASSTAERPRNLFVVEMSASEAALFSCPCEWAIESKAKMPPSIERRSELPPRRRRFLGLLSSRCIKIVVEIELDDREGASKQDHEV